MTTIKNIEEKSLVRKLAAKLATVTLTALIVADAGGKAGGQSFDSSLVLSMSGKESTGNTQVIGPLDPVALVFGGTYRSGTSTLNATMPQSYSPPIYGTSTSMAANSTVFRQVENGETDLRVGLRFLSIFEGGMIYNASSFKNPAPADNPFSGDYQTLWGAYGVGNYAAIGQLQVKESIGWYAQLQTPDINVANHLALAPFVFFSMTDSSVSFQSGYSRFAEAFNPGYASANLGTIKTIPARAGLSINYKPNQQWSIGLKGYAERDLGGFSETSQGNQFDAQYSAPHKISIGGGLEIQRRF